MDCVMSAQALEVRFGDVVALTDVSIEVPRGAIVAIVGRNACGKSTLLRALAGLLRPTHGSVEVLGLPLERLSPRTRAQAMAFVPQRSEISAPFTAREVVALGRFAAGASAARVEAALADVGMSARADVVCHRLSGGERQRVAVARALAQVDEGSVLLLDEPLAGVDPGEVARLVEVLRRRASSGGVLVTLHDAGLARAFATHAVVLAHGRVRAAGPAWAVLTPSELSEAYGHPMESADGWIAPRLTN